MHSRHPTHRGSSALALRSLGRIGRSAKRGQARPMGTPPRLRPPRWPRGSRRPPRAPVPRQRDLPRANGRRASAPAVSPGGDVLHALGGPTGSRTERFFLNVVLLRVLYPHALVAAPRLALGRIALCGRPLGDPRLGMAGVFLSLGRVLPGRYPVDDDLGVYLRAENTFGRLLDYAVIQPRLRLLYDWVRARARTAGACGARDR